jgi:hypothetical protein
MKPSDDSRMADEKAAIDFQRKQPSWRGTKAVNSAPTKWLWSAAKPYRYWWWWLD